MAIIEGFNRNCTQKILDGVNGQWASNFRLTILDSNNLKESLESARDFVTQFKDGEVTHKFQGKSYTFHFKYRDPWEWLVDLVTDPTLSNSIMWYPVEKYLHNGSKITRIYDEVNTGKRWWEIQVTVSLMNIWNTIINLEDKGKVSSTTKMHPIVLQAAFLPSEIRNASGNGGGVFIGLMPIVGNPNDSIESEDDTHTSVEIAQFKREIYHKVIHVIFRSIQKRSHHGDTLACGDKVRRVHYPGFLIHSVNGEEGCSTCGTRGAQAKHPCPKCLAEKMSLCMLSQNFTPRTQEDMMDIFRKVKDVGYSSRMSFLQDAGLHFVKNTFWKINNSSPYDAYSYDLLHAFDAGEWGKHLWPLVLEVLKPVKDGISRRHANLYSLTIAEMDFADGNSFRDILKLLPSNASLVHCIRVCTILRSIAGLRVVTSDQIDAYKKFLIKYEKWCKVTVVVSFIASSLTFI
ncbi:hypothetical protein M422DRAFT_267721 [Sphaerobolus stellatus SS14]|uniref:Uncharacterized protein n=1 Tax=Sphaerobolus stellatus (strain SS14) TaxID=990650 RepID=A0A0C9UZS6_SPHS4|nr:hypothetical protein M422DRAFT_267721 [Sphaerobolus stellatus SS14]